MLEENEKNNILSHISKMKKEYIAERTDIKKEEISFLDKLNKLVQLIMSDSSITIYKALNKESLEKWNKGRVTRWIKNLIVNNIRNSLYFLLLVTITGFLVSEALNFYAIDGVISAKTYVKAILTEVCFIFLSGYKSNGKTQALWAGILRIGIFCLMMFVITSQTLMIGTKGHSESSAIQDQVELISKQIREKDKEIIYYRDVRNWPITTKQLIGEKDKLVNKIISLKEQQQKGKNEEVSQVEVYKMYGKASFRVILLFISVLVTRRIFRF